MSIQFKFFHIPTVNSESSEAELNTFLRSVKTVQVKKECIILTSHAYWSIMVEYLEAGKGNRSDSRTGEVTSGKSKIDYKEILSPDDFALFAILREWRKETAAQEAVPVYTIFTNEQLAKIVEKKITSIGSLQEIEGVGDARIKKYGNVITALVAQGQPGKEE